MLLDSVARNWWVVLLRGIFAVIFGILAFAWPGPTLAALVFIFGIYAIADGLVAIGFGFSGGSRWWQMILVGLISLVAGVLTFVWPGLTAVALLTLIAAWAIVRGIMEIYAAIKLRALVQNEFLLIVGGVCSILFGAIVMARPRAGALAILWIIGFYAIFFGILTIALSLRLRSLKSDMTHGHGTGGMTPSPT
jgi:uncharacterized membrane protein HdeD (DUF308 family)